MIDTLSITDRFQESSIPTFDLAGARFSTLNIMHRVHVLIGGQSVGELANESELNWS